uniref:Uncharacterized protein n=1 Tax=Plectus sambesii TaxID=2011161 RepID=A0A914WZZ2_9BILA
MRIPWVMQGYSESHPDSETFFDLGRSGGSVCHENGGVNETLTYKLLSLKMAILLAFCRPKWVSEVNSLRLWVGDRMRNNRGSGPPNVATYLRCSDLLLCPGHTILGYIARTDARRGPTDKLLLSECTKWLDPPWSRVGLALYYHKRRRYPFHGAFHAIGRDIKADRAGLSAAQIMAAANWSPGSTTFASFSLRPVQQGFSAAVSISGSETFFN